ncbi:hypothetical protein E2C01_098444 [Portunus trituberculatus]|uniref:Uncharacterized protein n=1 Tax=Portunus trituberculatus TaxID=210409 RepID=A0A5B7KCX6_PORTR|nr:hypothetical protein [Portunus trituberculatus]
MEVLGCGSMCKYGWVDMDDMTAVGLKRRRGEGEEFGIVRERTAYTGERVKEGVSRGVKE